MRHWRSKSSHSGNVVTVEDCGGGTAATAMVDIVCSCQFWRSFGLLCRHSFAVLAVRQMMGGSVRIKWLSLIHI